MEVLVGVVKHLLADINKARRNTRDFEVRCVEAALEQRHGRHPVPAKFRSSQAFQMSQSRRLLSLEMLIANSHARASSFQSAVFASALQRLASTSEAALKSGASLWSAAA